MEKKSHLFLRNKSGGETIQGVILNFMSLITAAETTSLPLLLLPTPTHSHLHTHTHTLTHTDSGVGAGIDSYYEYCLKSYVLLGNKEYLRRFNKVRGVAM